MTNERLQNIPRIEAIAAEVESRIAGHRLGLDLSLNFPLVGASRQLMKLTATELAVARATGNTPHQFMAVKCRPIEGKPLRTLPDEDGENHISPAEARICELTGTSPKDYVATRDGATIGVDALPRLTGRTSHAVLPGHQKICQSE